MVCFRRRHGRSWSDGDEAECFDRLAGLDLPMYVFAGAPIHIHSLIALLYIIYYCTMCAVP